MYKTGSYEAGKRNRKFQKSVYDHPGIKGKKKQEIKQKKRRKNNEKII